MPKFAFEKLVRDKIAAKIEAEGHEVVWRKLEGEEYVWQLMLKMIEEVGELKGALEGGSREDIAKEYADVAAVFGALGRTLDLDSEDARDIGASKLEKSGGFDEGVYIENVKLAGGGDGYERWLRYFEGDPEKYPKIED